MKKIVGKLAVTIPLVSGLLLSGCGTVSQNQQDTFNSEKDSTSNSSSWKVDNEDDNSVNKDKNTSGIVVKSENADKDSLKVDNTAASKSSALTMLKKLKVSSEAKNSYSRSKFKHWTSNNSTKCNTRIAVLKAESKKKVKMSGCTIKSGSWVSAYDGKKFTNPSKMDIDHMVPLKEAWESGAYKWTSKTREKFANDLGYKNSLIAVSASSNRSKSDKDPNNWMPKKSKCSYTANWISVKYRWGLTVDKSEKSYLTKTVKSCKGLKADKVSKAKVSYDKKAKKKTTSSSPKKSPVKKPSGKNDPRFKTCTDAKKKGYGPYKKGKDAEYNWYIDRDKDGWACE